MPKALVLRVGGEGRSELEGRSYRHSLAKQGWVWLMGGSHLAKTSLQPSGTKVQWGQSWRASCRKSVLKLTLAVEEAIRRTLAEEGPGETCPPLTTSTWWRPPWHGAPFPCTSLARLPEPFPSCPWQGPAASVRLMKPSGCDTISSKLGREPLPGSSKGKRARSDK